MNWVLSVCITEGSTFCHLVYKKLVFIKLGPYQTVLQTLTNHAVVDNEQINFIWLFYHLPFKCKSRYGQFNTFTCCYFSPLNAFKSVMYFILWLFTIYLTILCSDRDVQGQHLLCHCFKDTQP